MGAEVGRAAADPLDRTRSATRRCCCTTTGCRTRSPATCRSDEWVQELLGANGGTFKNPATNYYQIETDIAEGDRERRPGVHGHAHPVRPVPQPPVRPLDDGRLLRLRRVLHADRPQGRPTTRASSIVFNSGGGEVNHPVARPADDAEVPRRRRAGRRRARTAARCWPTGWRRRRTRTSPRTWRTSSGRTSSARASSTRWTTCASATRRRNPELLDELGKKFTELQVRLQEAGPRHLHVADVPAVARSRTTTQRRRHAELRPRRRSAASGPRRCWTASRQVTETKNKFQGLPLGRPGGADRRRRRQHLLPDHVRPGDARDGLLVRGEAGADAVAGLHLLNGDTVDAEDRGRATWSASCSRRRRPPAQIIEELYIRCLSRKPTAGRDDEAARPLVEAAKDKKQALEDVFWALLNSREFMFNH